MNRLPAFGAKSQVDEALKSQAQNLADGNPRLLECLDKILQNTTVDQAAILNQLAADPVKLREQVLAKALLQQMDTTMREMLSRGLLYELPVPKEAILAVCESTPNLDQQINQAVALGLLEVSFDNLLRVPRILPLELKSPEVKVLYCAVEILYSPWWEKVKLIISSGKSKLNRVFLRNEQLLEAKEIFRLLNTCIDRAAEGLKNSSIIELAHRLKNANIFKDLNNSEEVIELLDPQQIIKLIKIETSEKKSLEDELIEPNNDRTSPANNIPNDQLIHTILNDFTLTTENKTTLMMMSIMKKMDKDVENSVRPIKKSTSSLDMFTLLRLSKLVNIKMKRVYKRFSLKLSESQIEKVLNMRENVLVVLISHYEPSIDVETMKLKRIIDKRSQMFDMLQQIIHKYNQTAKGIIESIGR
ncbi:hypothetical protein [Dendronalium sp. ChiSLP03b]|uniref:hypothetical protein n=1 Tax=Dendronalium sp. ChiSLP03b TaxID=3075381 RepID=UPI002AD44DC1|nr:hypothetical protein [Dendronalium sp. ChiSLP03b]MDZ8209131.1 hypothetical protein [Dendronalium sp. ChiSLP03b]